MRKSKIIMLILLSVLSFSLAGCATHSGYINNSVALNQANFNYVEYGVSGQAGTTHVFGIGGLLEDAIINSAKKDLLSKHPLGTNQALANVTVNWKNGIYFFVITRTCTVTADIVEFE